MALIGRDKPVRDKIGWTPAPPGSGLPQHALGAKTLAAKTRAFLGVIGLVLAIAQPGLPQHGYLTAAGFATILLLALVQLSAPKLSWMRVEELLAGIAGILIVGLAGQHVSALSIVWLAAIATGMIARGGRVHWVGRIVLLSAIALPIVRDHGISADYAGLCVATLALLFTSGQLMRELNHVLAQARHDADHDDLTGLLSRSAFRSALGKAARRATVERPVCLLLFDLDGFGKVNKMLGHAAGDSLLVAAARRLEASAEKRCAVGRLGGDEFAVLAPCEDPVLLAQRLLDGLSVADEGGRAVSACVGIAQAPSDGHDADALMMAADIAMRVAKRSSHGGHVSSYAGDSLSGEGRLSARWSLTRLIEGDGLSVVVQPIVDLRSGAVHAYEALARFGDASQSPLHWFSVAEELGVRDELERACLKAALRLLDRRPAGTKLTVNLSAPVLLDPITRRMLAAQADLSHLIVEVTEDALVASDGQLLDAIAPLLARGACLAVDDMGAGYSGLRQVTAVKPKYLKLDRSLIQGIDRNPEQAALVGALVGYAQRVDSLLVAEGIETAAELQVLVELRVPLAQGFHLARPGAPWQAPKLALSQQLQMAARGPQKPVAQPAPGIAGRDDACLFVRSRRAPLLAASIAPPLAASQRPSSAS